MAKYGKNNYFDGVILPEPKEEMLRRMAKGVKLGYNQISTASGAIKMVSPGIPIETNDVSIEFFGNSFGSNNYDRPFIFNNGRATLFQAYAKKIGQNGVLNAFYNSSVNKPRIGYSALTPNERFHFVWTREGTTLRAYINGNLMGSIENIPIADFGEFHLGIMNSSDVGFARVWNYALSAADVSALYNNGDPAGYKLPSNYKGYGDVYHSDFSEGADDWHVVLTDYVTMTVADGVITISKEDERRNMNIARNHNPYASRVVNYFVRLEFAEPLPSEVGNIAARPFNSIVGVNLAISSDRLSASGTLISTIAKPNGGSMIIFQASGAISISISSISFTPAVCIAEYLPHNLIPTAEGSVVKWLDSAPQLPEANGILPPLDASVGGYDLAAIGNPKIII